MAQDSNIEGKPSPRFGGSRAAHPSCRGGDPHRGRRQLVRLPPAARQILRGDQRRADPRRRGDGRAAHRRLCLASAGQRQSGRQGQRAAAPHRSARPTRPGRRRPDAQIAIAHAAADNVRATIHEQQATIEQTRAQLVQAQAKAAYDAGEVARYAPLVETGAREARAACRAAFGRGAVRSAGPRPAGRAGNAAASRRHAAEPDPPVRSPGRGRPGAARLGQCRCRCDAHARGHRPGASATRP